MTFEQKLRERLSKAPFRSREKELLKVVLGEVQLKSATAPVTEEQGNSLVKSMIKNNVEKVLVHLKEGDERRIGVLEENKILESLLPSYLTADEIEAKLNTDIDLVIQIKAAKSDGQATGLAMKFLKAQNCNVEGDTVKQVVLSARA